MGQRPFFGGITMKSKRLGTFLVFMAAVFYSLGGLGFKLIEDWNAFSINSARTFIGAAVVLVFMLITKRKIKFNKSVFLGAICVTGTNVLFAVANKLTTAANTIVLQFTAPIFVILICWLFLKQKPKKLDVIACAVVFAGVLCFVVDSLEMGGMLGNILALISGITYAGVFMLNDMPNGDSLSSVFWGLIISMLIGLPFLVQETTFAPMTIGTVTVLGVVQIGLAYTFIALGTKTTPPITASLVSGIEPVLNPILVAIFYPAEKVGPMAIVGTVIVVGGVVLYNVMKEKMDKKVITSEGESI